MIDSPLSLNSVLWKWNRVEGRGSELKYPDNSMSELVLGVMGYCDVRMTCGRTRMIHEIWRMAHSHSINFDDLKTSLM